MTGDESCSEKRRVVFIGGLADGRMVVEDLLTNSRVDLVGVYVLDDAAGGNVSGYISFDGLVPSPRLRKIKRIKEHSDEIASLTPAR